MHVHDPAVITRHDMAWFFALGASMFLVLALVFASHRSRPAWTVMDGLRVEAAYGNALPTEGGLSAATSSRSGPDRRLVALTFDDGPWPGQTDEVLRIFENQGARATFFMVGDRARAYPQLVRKVVGAGHLVGGHTLEHRRLAVLEPEEVRRQMVEGSNAITDVTGVAPTWFRPPYGAINRETMRQTQALGLRLAMWDIDTGDWRDPGVKKIVSRVMTEVENGSVIVLHDGGGDRRQTIAALPEIIRGLKERGYVLVTMQELADAK